MTATLRIRLARELRCGVWGAEAAAPAANNFAANPSLDDMGPFVRLTAVMEGPVDGVSGMLINLKHLDRTLRRMAPPLLREAISDQPSAIRGTGMRPEGQRRGHAARRTGGDSPDQRPVARGPTSETGNPKPPTGSAGIKNGHLLERLFNVLAPALVPPQLICLRLAASPWFYQELHRSEKPMIRQSQRFEFSAAHRLYSPHLTARQNQELFGKCTNPNGHGHNYELEVTIGGPIDMATGRLIPLEDFQRTVNERVIQRFDHKHLNLDCPEFAQVNPTVENIARLIFEQLRDAFTAPLKLCAVRVWETPKTCCEVTADAAVAALAGHEKAEAI